MSEYKIEAILFERDHGEWVAQCLQYDIGAQAETLADLAYQLQRSIVGHIVIALENGLEPLECLPPAPDEYWEMWRKATITVLAEDGTFRMPKGSPRVTPRLKVAA